MKTFQDFLSEARLKPGDVFTSLDKTGDLAGKNLYVKNIEGDDIVVLFPNDKKELYSTLSSLNIDKKSIRKYDFNSDEFII